ncbi:MAG: hypothetical protein JXA89_02395 [Anaerolineae bacterium]|nr:hypothetical protein [Anaerolineae bacterium]
MKKPLGCLSGYGLIASMLVLIGVVWFTLFKGAVLFSPGPLTAASRGLGTLQDVASHADLERECTRCHRPWGGADPARCLQCHTPVEEQISNHTGLHGRFLEAESCLRCHSDHQGREANITLADPSTFAHDQVGFALSRHEKRIDGTGFACKDCHIAPRYALKPAVCDTCHREMDTAFTQQHVTTYGADCLACHDGTGALVDFDHGTVFALSGVHATLVCRDCHTSGSFDSLSPACASCHIEPPVHQDQFGSDCIACHTTNGWQPARLQYHLFPLDHGGTGEVACPTCHADNYATVTCYSCHEHQPELVEHKHRKEGITDIAGCAFCHPTGRREENGD